MNYYKKVKLFNERKDYKNDVNTARLLLDFCGKNADKIFFVGTGLGRDTEIITKLKGKTIVGIEPRRSFHSDSEKKYREFNGILHKTNLGRFIKIQKKISGIVLFIHSFNHIPSNQIKLLARSLQKNTYIIIINPNPEIESIFGKTDKTVIKYWEANKIKKILKCKIIFDFFYHPIKLKNGKIFIREALLLWRN